MLIFDLVACKDRMYFGFYFSAPESVLEQVWLFDFGIVFYSRPQGEN